MDVNTNESEGVSSAKSEKRRKIFECEFCGKLFDHSSNLVAHHQVHREDKYHKCNQCDELFDNRSRLNAHRKKTHMLSNVLTLK